MIRSVIPRLREVGRQLGVGRLLWRYVYQPTRGLRWTASFGLRNAMRLAMGEAAMRRAARNMPALETAAGSSPLAVTYMTGRRHWHQTAFAAMSLAQVLPQGVAPTFLDDGTLRPRECGYLLRLFPNGRVVDADQIAAQLDQHLPASKFPMLRLARTYVLGRKLIDLRAAGKGWQLYLDSDMLFFGRPRFLEQCHANRQTCHMHDHGDNFYVRPAQDLSRICGFPVQERINAGIVGMDDSLIDWEQVEAWCRQFTPAEVVSHLFEQTLTAMILSGLGSVAPPAKDYRIVYKTDDVEEGAILVHYLYRAKVDFLWRDWRRVAGRPHDKS